MVSTSGLGQYYGLDLKVLHYRNPSFPLPRYSRVSLCTLSLDGVFLYSNLNTVPVAQACRAICGGKTHRRQCSAVQRPTARTATEHALRACLYFFPSRDRLHKQQPRTVKKMPLYMPCIEQSSIYNYGVFSRDNFCMLFLLY